MLPHASPHSFRQRPVLRLVNLGKGIETENEMGDLRRQLGCRPGSLVNLISLQDPRACLREGRAGRGKAGVSELTFLPAQKSGG